MKRYLLPILFVATALVWTSNSSALGRDADGSRMQARPHTLGSTDTDRLSPPKDSVDWRYVRLSKSQKVTFSVSSQPSSSTVQVTITNATGKKLGAGSTKGGSFTSSRRLDPGLYYVSVSSSSSVSYTISIR